MLSFEEELCPNYNLSKEGGLPFAFWDSIQCLYRNMIDV